MAQEDVTNFRIPIHMPSFKKAKDFFKAAADMMATSDHAVDFDWKGYSFTAKPGQSPEKLKEKWKKAKAASKADKSYDFRVPVVTSWAYDAGLR